MSMCSLVPSSSLRKNVSGIWRSKFFFDVKLTIHWHASCVQDNSTGDTGIQHDPVDPSTQNSDIDPAKHP